MIFRHCLSAGPVPGLRARRRPFLEQKAAALAGARTIRARLIDPPILIQPSVNARIRDLRSRFGKPLEAGHARQQISFDQGAFPAQ
jgi:hypothetical protein